MRAALAMLALLLPPATAGSTWIVDDDGPADFDQIQAAIDAAQPGDTLLIQDGSYSVFALDKGLTLVGYGSVRVPGVSSVLGITSMELAILDQLTLSELRVTGNEGPVVLRNVSLSQGANRPHRLEVLDSSDVRAFGLVLVDSPQADPLPTVHVERSRLELTRASIEGTSGPQAPPCNAAEGSTALSVGMASRVHAALTDAEGGIGGCSQAGTAGTGGAGAWIDPTAVLIITGGDDSLVSGGLGGLNVNSSNCSSTGLTGPGAFVEGILIHSGAVIVGNCDDYGVQCNVLGCAPDFTGAGAVLPSSPDDPTLDLVGATAAGNLVQFDVTAPPGADVLLYLGRKPIVTPDPTVEIELLTPMSVKWPLGTVPASGGVSKSYKIRPLNPGFDFYAQAEVTYPGGDVRRTNSIPLVVR